MLFFIKRLMRVTFLFLGASFTDIWDPIVAWEVSSTCEQVRKVIILVSLDCLACKGANVLVL